MNTIWHHVLQFLDTLDYISAYSVIPQRAYIAIPLCYCEITHLNVLPATHSMVSAYKPPSSTRYLTCYGNLQASVDWAKLVRFTAHNTIINISGLSVPYITLIKCNILNASIIARKLTVVRSEVAIYLNHNGVDIVKRVTGGTATLTMDEYNFCIDCLPARITDVKVTLPQANFDRVEIIGANSAKYCTVSQYGSIKQRGGSLVNLPMLFAGSVILSRVIINTRFASTATHIVLDNVCCHSNNKHRITFNYVKDLTLSNTAINNNIRMPDALDSFTLIDQNYTTAVNCNKFILYGNKQHMVKCRVFEGHGLTSPQPIPYMIAECKLVDCNFSVKWFTTRMVTFTAINCSFDHLMARCDELILHGVYVKDPIGDIGARYIETTREHFTFEKQTMLQIFNGDSYYHTPLLLYNGIVPPYTTDDYLAFIDYLPARLAIHSA